MSPFFLMIPVLLPVAGGGLLFLRRFREDRNRELYTEAVVCLTSVLVWTALFLVKPGKAEIYSFTGGFPSTLPWTGWRLCLQGWSQSCGRRSFSMPSNT